MARSRMPAGAVKFEELHVSDPFYMRSDKTGGVYKKCSREAFVKPEGGTSKASLSTPVWPLTSQERSQWELSQAPGQAAVEVGTMIPREEPQERRLLVVTPATPLEDISKFIITHHGDKGATVVSSHLYRHLFPNAKPQGDQP